MARVPSYMDLPAPETTHVPAPLTGRVTDVSEGLVGITYTDPASGDDAYVEAPASPGRYAPGAPVVVPAPGMAVTAPITLPTVEGLVEVGPAPDGPGTALGGRLGNVEAVQGNLQAQLAATTQQVQETTTTVTAQLNDLDNALAAAQGTAQTAKHTAEAAQEAAHAAQTTAASATASATQAGQVAQAAKTTADSAQNTAYDAAQAAVQAKTAAQNAQGTANQAKSQAGAALNEAKTGPVSTARLFAGAQKIGGALIGQNAIGAEHVVASKALSAKAGQFLEVTTGMLTAGNATIAGTAVVGALRGNILDGGEVIVRNQSPVAPASYTGGWSNARPVTSAQEGAPTDPQVTVTSQGGGWRIRSTQQHHAYVELTAASWFPPIPQYGEIEVGLQVTTGHATDVGVYLNGHGDGRFLQGHVDSQDITLRFESQAAAVGAWNQRLILFVQSQFEPGVDVTVRITSIRVRQRGSGTAHLGRDQHGQAAIAMTTAAGDQAVRIHVEGDDEGVVTLRGRITSPGGDTHTEVKLNSRGVDYAEDGAGKPFVSWERLSRLMEAIYGQASATQTVELNFGNVPARKRMDRQVIFDHPIPDHINLRDVRIEIDGRVHPRVNVGVENLTRTGVRVWVWNYTDAQALNAAALVRVIPPLDL